MIILTGVIKSDTNTVMGYRFFDDSKSEPLFIPNMQIGALLQTNQVVNAVVTKGELELTDSSINQLPIVDETTCRPRAYENRLFVLSRQTNAEGIVRYHMLDSTNSNVCYMNEEQVISFEKTNGFVNAKVVNRDGKKYISAIKGSFREEVKPTRTKVKRKGRTFNEEFIADPEEFFKTFYKATGFILSSDKDILERQKLLEKHVVSKFDKFPEGYVYKQTLSLAPDKRITINFMVSMVDNMVASMSILLIGRGKKIGAAELLVGDLEVYTNSGANIDVFARVLVKYIEAILESTNWFTRDSKSVEAMGNELYTRMQRKMLQGRPHPVKDIANQLMLELTAKIDPIMTEYVK